MCNFIARMAEPQLVHSITLIVSAAPQLYLDFQQWIYHLAIPFHWPEPYGIKYLNGESIVNYTREWGTKGGTYVVNTMGTILSWTVTLH